MPRPARAPRLSGTARRSGMSCRSRLRRTRRAGALLHQPLFVARCHTVLVEASRYPLLFIARRDALLRSGWRDAFLVVPRCHPFLVVASRDALWRLLPRPLRSLRPQVVNDVYYEPEA